MEPTFGTEGLKSPKQPTPVDENRRTAPKGAKEVKLAPRAKSPKSRASHLAEQKTHNPHSEAKVPKELVDKAQRVKEALGPKPKENPSLPPRSISKQIRAESPSKPLRPPGAENTSISERKAHFESLFAQTETASRAGRPKKVLSQKMEDKKSDRNEPVKHERPSNPPPIPPEKKAIEANKNVKKPDSLPKDQATKIDLSFDPNEIDIHSPDGKKKIENWVDSIEKFEQFYKIVPGDRSTIKIANLAEAKSLITNLKGLCDRLEKEDPRSPSLPKIQSLAYTNVEVSIMKAAIRNSPPGTWFSLDLSSLKNTKWLQYEGIDYSYLIIMKTNEPKKILLAGALDGAFGDKIDYPIIPYLLREPAHCIIDGRPVESFVSGFSKIDTGWVIVFK